MTRDISTTAAVLMMAVLASQVGCQSLSSGKQSDWKLPSLSNNSKPVEKTSESPKVVNDEKNETKKFDPLAGLTKKSDSGEVEYSMPTKLAVIWTDSTYTGANVRATRGFGGRFYFYDEDGETISVDGELVIYGFDDSSDATQQKIPDRKFVFRQEDLQKHRSESGELGVSYSFWIPWDGIGGERKSISLLPIFKPAEGALIRGEIAVNVLPGTVPAGEIPAGMMAREHMTESFTYPSRQVGFENGSAAGGQQTVGRMKTATINVPQDLGSQLQTPQGTNPSWMRRRMQMLQSAPQQQGNALVGTGPAPGFGTGFTPDADGGSQSDLQSTTENRDRYPSSTTPRRQDSSLRSRR